MERRYQVFVSSTYEDLKRERGEILKSLLNNNHIPSGMEYFPASSKKPIELIRKRIEVSDFYVIIVGKEYGSLYEDGVSYTEHEFNHAIASNIPIMAFIKNLPASSRSMQLNMFITRLQSLGTTSSWKSVAELVGNITSSINHEIAQGVRPGWVRGKTKSSRTAKTVV